MSKKGKRNRGTAVPLEALNFKSSLLERNSLKDCNSIDYNNEELSFSKNGYSEFRFLNNEIIAEIGFRPPREKIIDWLKRRRIFFMDFNLQCVREYKGHRYYRPVELAVVAYSMAEGIVNEFHSFIDCGDIPDRSALSATENFKKHGIPIFDRSSLELLCLRENTEVISKLKEFIVNEQKSLTKDQKFVAFNVFEKVAETYGGYEWLSTNAIAGESNYLPPHSVLSIFDLTFEILNFMQKDVKHDVQKIESEFNCPLFEYENAINCYFHESIDNYNCSIGNCRRMVAVFSLLLSKHFGTVPILRKTNRIDSDDKAIVKVFNFKAPTDLSLGHSKDGEKKQQQTSARKSPPGFEHKQPLKPPPGFVPKKTGVRIPVETLMNEFRKANI